jgi:hypothetical protein
MRYVDRREFTMHDEPEVCTPSEPELELASDLAHYISIQAEGTRDSERLWIYAAARQIERLLSGSATSIDFAAARSHLQILDRSGQLGRQGTSPQERLRVSRQPAAKAECESRQRRAA